MMTPYPYLPFYVRSMRRSSSVFFGLFNSEAMESDGLTLAFGIFGEQREDVRASSLQAGYVKVRLVALDAGDCDQTVAVLGL